MKLLQLKVALLAVAALIAFGAAMPAAGSAAPRDPAPVVRQWPSQQHGGETSESSHDVLPMVWWTVAGVGGGAVVFGTLYLFKRRVGGFPRNPSWVAPISIMPSSELPDDTDSLHEAQSHEVHL